MDDLLVKRERKEERNMKMKLITLMALVALMMALVPAPAFAQIRFDGDRHDRNDHFFNRGGGGSFEIGDAENESGDIETENNFSIEGNNNNACLGQLQFGQTGNFTNQQGVGQFFSGADDIEFDGGEITFAPENETVCDQAVQQSAAASSWGSWW
jgi:hypothetical protein